MSVRKVLMGYTSQGPLALWGASDKAALLDVQRLEPIETNIDLIRGTEKWGFDARVAPDGRTFVTWHNGLWPSNFGIQHFTADRKLVPGGALEGGINENWIQPNTDGSLLMHNSGRTFSRDLQPFAAEWLLRRVLMPADDPRFFLAAHGLDVDVCTSSDRRPVFTVTDKALERMSASSAPTRWFHTGGEPCIHYLPEFNLLAILADTQVVVRPLNLIEELEKDGRQYLFVLSQPRTHVKAGTAYEYKLEVRSKAPGVACKLEKGPDGMTVSPGGVVRWNVPPNQTGKAAPVIISVKNASGKELFHSFDLVAD
jgi:hypothetical protein